jgi:hypothetical protein
MNPIKPQVLAAIGGALEAYLEEEAAVLAQGVLAAAGPPPGPPVNLWGTSGRQWAMQMRALTQRRSLS